MPIIVSQIINCATCFILTIDVQIGLMRSDSWNSQCSEPPQISVITMTTNDKKLVWEFVWGGGVEMARNGPAVDLHLCI